MQNVFRLLIADILHVIQPRMNIIQDVNINIT